MDDFSEHPSVISSEKVHVSLYVFSGFWFYVESDLLLKRKFEASYIYSI